MGKEIKGITAEEARALADTSDYTIKHIYKEIRALAAENATSIEWCLCGLSNKALDEAITQLEEDGFTVEKADESLKVSW